MAAIDLEETRQLDRALRLFSLDRPNLFALYARDYTTSLDPHAHWTSLDAAVHTTSLDTPATSLDAPATSLDAPATSLDAPAHPTSLDAPPTSLDAPVHPTSLDAAVHPTSLDAPATSLDAPATSLDAPATSLDAPAHPTSLDARATSLDAPVHPTSLDAPVHTTSLDAPATSLDAPVHPTSLAPRVQSSFEPRVESQPLAHDVTSTTLVTNLRFAGYAFNPVSFFLRYAGDDLVSVIAEVNNTYGGRHCYTLDARNRIASVNGDGPLFRGASVNGDGPLFRGASVNGDGPLFRGASVNGDGPLFRRVGFRTTREFFVSPFLHGPRVYEWWFPARRDPARLAITMHVDTPDGARIFTATFAGERRALSDRALAGAALRYPVNTAQVIGLIHLEAMKLRFLHREPYRRPGPDHRPLDA